MVNQGIYVTTYGKDVQCGIKTFVDFKQKAASYPFKIISASHGAEYAEGNKYLIGEIDPKKHNPMAWDEALRHVEGRKPIYIQHAFGIFATPELIKDIKYLKKNHNADIYIRMHTLYSDFIAEPEGTPYGMRGEEKEFLETVLPDVKAIVTFSDCTHTVCIKTFPEHAHKFTVIRHGAHNYPCLTTERAREKVLEYIWGHNSIADTLNTNERMRITKILKGGKPLIGACGFVNSGREYIFELKDILGDDVCAFHIGDLHSDALKYDYKDAKEALARMKEYGKMDGNIFIHAFPDDEMFNFFVTLPNIFYSFNPRITQSGRTMVRIGTGDEKEQNFPAILAGDFEGDGEALRMLGFPLAKSGEELPDIAARLLDMSTVEKAYIWDNIVKYRRMFSWAEQADKADRLVNWPHASALALDAGSTERFQESLERVVIQSASAFRPTGTYATGHFV